MDSATLENLRVSSFRIPTSIEDHMYLLVGINYVFAEVMNNFQWKWNFFEFANC